MENTTTYINEINEKLLNSPISNMLANRESIPFKEMILKKLSMQLDSLKVIDKNKETPLNVVIVGEVKAGKSSLLNALLGIEISQVDVLEATSAMIKVAYDEENNTKVYDREIVVGVNVDYLKKVNLVDTPGLKSITKENEKKTLGYIKNADLILFVIDATHLGQEDVLESLELICEYKKNIVGVVNKCDLISDEDEVVEYINDEYGIYIDKFFMISASYEYQNKVSKRSIARNTDLVISNYETLRENFIKLNEYIKDLYVDSKELKKDSINSSLENIIQKDILDSYEYKQSINVVLEELKRYELLIENKNTYMNSKMEFEVNNWIENVFLDEEIQSIKENIEDVSIYINDNYINDIINAKKIQLDKIFFKEWSECLREVSSEMNDDIKRYVKDITYENELLDTPKFKLEDEKPDINSILATVGTGALLGATSGGILSVYSAALSTSAASITISTSLMTYFAPFLLAGTLSGALGKIIYDKIKLEERKKEILNNIDDFVYEVKVKVKKELLKSYETLSKDIVFTTMDILKNVKGIYINKYEIEELINNIDEYILDLKQYIK